MKTILIVLLSPIAAQLSHPDFQTRETAQRWLECLLWLSRPSLAHCARFGDPEAAQRAEMALERSYARWRAFTEQVFRKPGWCDRAEAEALMAAGGDRLLDHLGRQAGILTGSQTGPWTSVEFAPWGRVAALVNYCRSQYRGDGRLEWRTPWRECVDPTVELLYDAPREVAAARR